MPCCNRRNYRERIISSMRLTIPILALLCTMAVGLWPVCVMAAAAEPKTASLAISISGFQNDSGSAAIALWKQPGQGFPIKVSQALRTIKSPISNKVVLVVFDNLAPDNYAVSVFHDLNNNDKLDRNTIGMPAEPRGVSRNPKPFMRPPRYDESNFDIHAGDNRIEISMTD